MSCFGNSGEEMVKSNPSQVYTFPTMTQIRFSDFDKINQVKSSQSNIKKWLEFTRVKSRIIDHMHMTSQKGAQLRWGSNESLPRASLPSMQPGGQPLHCHTAELARLGPRTERLSANAHCQQNTCALRDTSLASLLWRCDPLWRQCIRSITSLHNLNIPLLIVSRCLLFFSSLS